jgi:imidazolonepropionase-like amidohydrolase
VNATDAARLEARPEMRYVHPADRANWQPVSGASPMSVQREASRQRGRMIRALKDSGAGILLGTDAWISYVIHGFSIHDELRLLVEDAAFTRYEALRAGTADAARAVGAQDEWGTIAPGLAADLLLLDANPLDDLANLRRRSGVMAGGTWFSEAELRRRLEALAERYESGEFSAP